MSPRSWVPNPTSPELRCLAAPVGGAGSGGDAGAIRLPCRSKARRPKGTAGPDRTGPERVSPTW